MRILAMIPIVWYKIALRVYVHSLRTTTVTSPHTLPAYKREDVKRGDERSSGKSVICTSRLTQSADDQQIEFPITWAEHYSIYFDASLELQSPHTKES